METPEVSKKAIEDAEAVEEMVRSAGWKVLTSELSSRCDLLFRKLVKGEYGSGESYDFVRAQIVAIDAILTAPRSILAIGELEKQNKLQEDEQAPNTDNPQTEDSV